MRLQAFGRLDADGSRYLLGDDLGNMYLLVLAHNGEAVMGLKMEIIGEQLCCNLQLLINVT